MMSKSACILLGLVLALGPAGAAAQVTKNIPTITWAAPAAITYGTALSATQLDATTSISGIFVYTPAVVAYTPAVAVYTPVVSVCVPGSCCDLGAYIGHIPVGVVGCVWL